MGRRRSPSGTYRGTSPLSSDRRRVRRPVPGITVKTNPSRPDQITLQVVAGCMIAERGLTLVDANEVRKALELAVSEMEARSMAALPCAACDDRGCPTCSSPDES